MTSTVFVIDDDASVRRGLARLLKSAGYTVEVFASADSFLARPSVASDGCILVDLRMPGKSGLELQEALMAAGADLPLIFISGDADVPSSVRALKRGVVDFLVKPFDDATMLAVVETALARHAEERAARAQRQSASGLLATLTAREREVCLLVARGLPNKQIAFELGTVEKTVKVHRARAMAKLRASSLPDLVRIVDLAQSTLP
jgi:FixJ family two-component response regulator